MTLNVGDTERIEQPSAEQINHFLRFMPPSSPFIVLSRDDDSFMQATPDGTNYRVEYQERKLHYFVTVSVGNAEMLFGKFLSGDESFRTDENWRRFNFLSDPQIGLIVLVILLCGVACIGIWQVILAAMDLWKVTR